MWTAVGVFFLWVLLGPGSALAQCLTSQPPLQPAPSVTRCGNPEFSRCRIDVAGVRRFYCIHVPDAPPATAAPPVTIAFHGANDRVRDAVEWLDKHTQQGIVLIAPAALPSRDECIRSWRHLALGRIPDWAAFGLADTCPDQIGPWPAGSPNRNDLDFTAVLLDRIDEKFKKANKYALGFSNGAGFVMQLFITQPLAERFDGYAMIANGMNKTKFDAQQSGSFGPYSANAETRRPAILIWGTSDKYVLPAETMISEINRLHDFAPLPPDHVCKQDLDTPEAVIECLIRGRIMPNSNQHAFASRIELTRAWLVRFNGAFTRAIEGLYPDRGHSDGNPEDETLVTRRDYLAKPGGEPVSVLTIVNGRHNVPGRDGAHPACPSGSCDINAVEEIFQFWRAHAGFRNLWR